MSTTRFNPALCTPTKVKKIVFFFFLVFLLGEFTGCTQTGSPPQASTSRQWHIGLHPDKIRGHGRGGGVTAHAAQTDKHTIIAHRSGQRITSRTRRMCPSSRSSLRASAPRCRPPVPLPLPHDPPASLYLPPSLPPSIHPSIHWKNPKPETGRAVLHSEPPQRPGKTLNPKQVERFYTLKLEDACLKLRP